MNQQIPETASTPTTSTRRQTFAMHAGACWAFERGGRILVHRSFVLNGIPTGISKDRALLCNCAYEE
jgi:hypothetical protein